MNPTDPVTITLEVQQMNVLLAGLGELPWKISNAVIQAIVQQIEPPQQQPVGNGLDHAELPRPPLTPPN